MYLSVLGILILLSNYTHAHMPQSFETQRLHAQKVTDHHKVCLKEILNDPQVQEVYNTTDIETFTNVAAQLEIIQNQWDNYGYGLYIIFNKETAEFIGFAGFHATNIEEDQTIDVLSEKDRNELEIYALFMPQHWRQGYGFEIGKELINLAFTHLPHTSIIAFAEAKNSASLGIIKKFNFQQEHQVNYNNESHILYRLKKSDLL